MNSNLEPMGNERKKYVFEIFKGAEREDGKIISASRLGQATLYEGAGTYNLYINTFLSDEARITFYMFPENDETQPHQYVILTRQKSIKPDRKYYWQKVGRAYKVDNQGEPLLNLEWDFFKTENVYMNHIPYETVGVKSHLSVA